MKKIGRPNLNDSPAWYSGFLALAAGDDLIRALKSNRQQMLDLIGSVGPSAENFRYSENKWTIKQVLIHLADDERYYAYKAFCYSRQCDVHLEIPRGEGYTKDFNADNRTLKDVRAELITVRDATISLFGSMTTEMLDFKDFPGKEVYTARSLGWFTVGHNIHHLNVIRTKYLAQIT
ncbi:MAG TPA: DinB family protein [Puia sp.]|nr:DinB family protein [Puia sp.]